MLKRFAIASVLAWFCVGPVAAGPYTDDLSKCLVESSTTEDRASLVRWMFGAMSAHPAVGTIAKVPTERVDAANKEFAQLFMRLLTDACKSQAQKALRFEGETALVKSFEVLGSAAATEIFSSPEVSGAMSGIQQHVDESKLKALLQDDSAADAKK
jgi:hypothetical protein